MSRLRVALSLAGFITAMAPEAVASQANKITVDKLGNAQCSGGNVKASSNKMSTQFANNYWSHMACGQWEKANEILKAAPKADPQRGIPSILDNESKLATCYKDSFAYGARYHNVTAETKDATTELSVKHGFYNFGAKDFWNIQRAVVAACDAKLGPK